MEIKSKGDDPRESFAEKHNTFKITCIGKSNLHLSWLSGIWNEKLKERAWWSFVPLFSDYLKERDLLIATGIATEWPDMQEKHGDDTMATSETVPILG